MNCSHPLTSGIRFSTKAIFLILQGVCTYILLSFSNALSVDNKADTPAQPQNVDNLPYEYQLENRSDPFAPFITEKAAAASVDMNEIVDETGPLTGMQLFEPGQLTLVALLKKDEANLAMVQDFTGKGYVLSEGTKIGRRGVVKNIEPKSVLIEETAVTRAGKKIVTEVVMLLKKEGEE